MRAILFLLAAAAFTFGADVKNDDPWAKVKDLKSGSDIRVYKVGVAQPVVAKSGDVTEDRVIVIIKNEETGIRKKDIDHIDYHPPGNKPTKSQTRTQTHDASGSSDSYSSNLSWGRDGWQTIYQRK
ncbi:MAG TPA: hypothetical protein VGL72_09905 [Bryobacteraceae bacterium]|jgi:hypothetical protein